MRSDEEDEVRLIEYISGGGDEDNDDNGNDGDNSGGCDECCESCLR